MDDFDLRPKGSKWIVKVLKPVKWLVYAAFIPILIFGFVMCRDAGCTAPDRSRETLEKAGYRNIKIKDGYQWLTCGKGDTYATGFSATNPEGRPVEGAVCCGIMKGCTIRF